MSLTRAVLLCRRVGGALTDSAIYRIGLAVESVLVTLPRMTRTDDTAAPTTTVGHVSGLGAKLLLAPVAARQPSPQVLTPLALATEVLPPRAPANVAAATVAVALCHRDYCALEMGCLRSCKRRLQPQSPYARGISAAHSWRRAAQTPGSRRCM